MSFVTFTRLLVVFGAAGSAVVAFGLAFRSSLNARFSPLLVLIGVWSLIYAYGMAALAFTWLPDRFVLETLNIAAAAHSLGWAYLGAWVWTSRRG